LMSDKWKKSTYTKTHTLSLCPSLPHLDLAKGGNEGGIAEGTRTLRSTGHIQRFKYRLQRERARERERER
jgi:hypothetical protein